MPEPATPPPAQTPPATTPPEKPQLVSDDPFMARMLSDMGKIVKEGKLEAAPAALPETQSVQRSTGFTTMGEAARFKAEAAELAAEGKPKEEKPDEKAGDGDPEKEEAEEKSEDGKTPPVSEEPAAEDKKAGDAPAPDVKPAEAPAKKVAVEKAKPIEEIVEGIVNRLQKPDGAPSEAKKAETPVADPDADYIATLDEAQRDSFELARFAAAKMPDKYASMPQRTVEYFKQVDAYIEAHRKEDSDWDPEDDDKFQALIAKSKPKFLPGDQRKLERSLIVDEVRHGLEAEFKPQVEEAQRVARVAEIKPELDRATDDYRRVIGEKLTADPQSPLAPVLAKAAAKGWTEEGWKEASEIDPLAASTAKQFLDTASEYGREVLALATEVSKPVQFNSNLPPNHPLNVTAKRQSELFGFISTQEQIFARDGGAMKNVGGKTFVTRQEFAKMTAAEKTKHWVLGPQDVLDMLTGWATNSAKIVFESEVARRKREGYERVTKTETPKKEDPKPPESKASTKAAESPKATVSQIPGGGTPPKTPSVTAGMSKEELEHLWAGGPATMVS